MIKGYYISCKPKVDEFGGMVRLFNFSCREFLKTNSLYVWIGFNKRTHKRWSIEFKNDSKIFEVAIDVLYVQFCILMFRWKNKQYV